ncbi:hypothetical protein [Herbaspirillum huttiense]|uniref:hypothetical protein n=1 Tax=Herbaspirillum huttiense TaxID=863372 RepID=UPI001E4CEC5A|nr:hypothetical protein [Herbaspirillum huttiense]
MAIDTSSIPLGNLDPYGLPGNSASAGNSAVKAVNDPAAVAQAVELAAQASVVVSLGGASSGNGALTYNAAGLFDAIVGAGSSAGTSTDLTQNQATQSYYQGVLGSIVTPGATSGIYDGSGVFAGEGLSSQLSLLLKSQPDLTGSIVEDIVNQNVVGGLISTMA